MGMVLTQDFVSPPMAANIAADDRNQFEAYKEGAEKGNMLDQKMLAYCYEQGRGVPKDVVEAVKWYLKAAEQGDSDAQSSLGFCYQDGKGVPKDDIAAAKWFRRAAEQGHRLAESCLGRMYESGTGVPQDYQEAAKWYRKAAEQYGDPGAELALGMLYEKNYYVK